MATVSVFDGIDEHWKKLEENVYLHTLEEDYEYAKSVNPYERIAVKLQDDIWDKLIEQQKEREMALFKYLGMNVSNSIEGARKLTEWVETGGGFNEFITNSNDELRNLIGDLLKEAIERADVDWNSSASVENLSLVYDAVEEVLQEKMNNLQGNYNKEIIKAFGQERDAFTLESAKTVGDTLRKYDQKRKVLVYDNFNTYVESLIGKKSSAISGFKGAVTENAVALGLKAIFKNIKGNKVDINVSGLDKLNGKQVKADNTITVETDDGLLTYGLSMKNYSFNQSTGRVTSMKLQDDASLQSFINNLSHGAILNDAEGTQDLQRTAERFNSNNFKYHLINETLFNNYNPKTTEPGRNVLELVKQAMFFFIGTELIKDITVANTDFMVIQGTFIPASDIMTNIGRLKVNFQPSLKADGTIGESMTEILNVKKETPVEESSDYYSSPAIKKGSELGDKMLKKIIKLSNVKMSLTIKDYL